MVDPSIPRSRDLSGDSPSTGKISSGEQLDELNESAARQVESAEDFQQWAEQSAATPWAVRMRQNFRGIDDFTPTRKKEKVAEEMLVVEEVQETSDTAHRYQRENPELLARSLMILRARIRQDDTRSDILRKVLEAYPDHYLADEALGFLLETTTGALKEEVQAARDELRNNFSRQIAAGRNMSLSARDFSRAGLGSPTALRDMYNDITGTPRETLKLFDELTARFNYVKMKSVIDFLLHALGKDLKSKGPSIAHAELKRLIDETKALQAILGVFRFFRLRMNLIRSRFMHYGLAMPSTLNFEMIARMFVKLLGERYMNLDKLLQAAKLLGLEETAAQIILYMQYYDGFREVAPRLYRDTKQRDELIKLTAQYLEDLEELYEKDEEEKEKEKKKK